MRLEWYCDKHNKCGRASCKILIATMCQTQKWPSQWSCSWLQKRSVKKCTGDAKTVHERNNDDVEESIKWVFFLNDLSIYFKEDTEIMSIKQMCKEVLYNTIHGITRFEFIKKDRKPQQSWLAHWANPRHWSVGQHLQEDLAQEWGTPSQAWREKQQCQG